MLCQCGINIKERSISAHLRGKLHQNADRIRALLEKECVTFTEIAKRLDVTREYIRQVALKMGYKPGRERQFICARDTALDRFSKVENWPKLIQKLKRDKPEFKINPILATKGTSHIYYLKSFIAYVNGWKCGLRTVTENRKQEQKVKGKSYENSYWLVHSWNKRKKVNFVLYSSSLGWYVFPIDKAPSSYVTAFVGKDRERKGNKLTDECWGANSRRHDFNNYWEAWHLLKEK